jgi:hypothetical protein
MEEDKTRFSSATVLPGVATNDTTIATIATSPGGHPRGGRTTGRY